MYAHYFQPHDENALRHLFSSRLGEDTLRMSYIGPVLDPSNRPLTSPDCLILDRRAERWKVRTCEFKYQPESKLSFANNGQFEVAIVWRIPPSIRESLKQQLAEQNGCQEIIILSNYPAFSNLPTYRALRPGELEAHGVDQVERVLLSVRNTAYPTSYVAYIAAAISPLSFDLEIMKDAISQFPEVQKMLPQGRGNIISKLLQTKPPLLTLLHHNRYTWVAAIHAEQARAAIGSLISTRLRRDVPSPQVIAKFKATAY
jgi:hypothetical protein